jgi:predicted AlkP superfamily pyrophosphatase or phosphodiesterase
MYNRAGHTHKKRKSIMKRFFIILSIGFTGIFLFGQQKKDVSIQPVNAQGIESPKLVVGIVVDQMRYDYIYRFWNKFGEGGFRRLVNDGFFCRNTHYNYMPTETGPGHASIYTGATPSIHGIAANDMVDRRSGKDTIYCVNDYTQKSIGTTTDEGKRSPHYMLSSTMCDQLRLATQKKAKVVGIALKDRAAILPAGHLSDNNSGTSAYWYEDETGNFISSSFYMQQLPEWVKTFNSRMLPKQYLAEPWQTLRPIEEYTESGADNTPYEKPFTNETLPVFPHKVNELAAEINRFSVLRNTPFGSSFTKDFALAAIEAEQLGKRGVTDFLAVSFSSLDIVGHQFGPMSVEVEDAYLRLDSDIAELLNFVDSTIGKKNMLVFLTADHGVVDVPQYLIDNHLPGGYFDETSATRQIRKALVQHFGDSALLLTVSNYQAFLNHKRISERGLSAKDVERCVADAFVKMDGIADVITASTMQSAEFTKGPRGMIQNGWHAQRSGDICYILSPGWLPGTNRKGTSHGSPWTYDTHVPLIWWGWKIKPGETHAYVRITDIAPTVCHFLNIQPPDGASGQPLDFFTY